MKKSSEVWQPARDDRADFVRAVFGQDLIERCIVDKRPGGCLGYSRLARAWARDRSYIVDQFMKVGWIGCLMPMVFVLPPQPAQRADVQPEPLRDQNPPPALDDGH